MAINKDKLIEYYREIEEVMTDLREFEITPDSADRKIRDINDRMKKDGLNIEVNGDNFIDDIESNKSYEYEDSYEE